MSDSNTNPNPKTNMPHINELRESKFLKKEDVGRGALLTITGCVQENVAQQGQPDEMKWCLTFQETEKPMVLNATNGAIIAGFLGSENTDDWVGRQIVLFDDPNVMFAGKRVGGIRARAPRNQVAGGTVQPRPVQPRPVQPSRSLPSDGESFGTAMPVQRPAQRPPAGPGGSVALPADSEDVPF